MSKANIALMLLSAFFPAILLVSQGEQEGPLGFTDTPYFPDSKWRVHDGQRPQPRVVEPGAAPSDAIVLFDGSSLDHWSGKKGPARWKVEGGCMVVNGTGNIRTKKAFGDCQLHIEWATPEKVSGRGQGRGNSGVYMMGRYEIQVLDSYKNPTYPDGQSAALYGQFPPLVNACRGPGEWQTYDIIFMAPRFQDGKLATWAHVTVIHNGIVVHHYKGFMGAQAYRALPKYLAHEPQGPIMLQDHGNPVRYRNIWVRPLTGYDRN